MLLLLATLQSSMPDPTSCSFAVRVEPTRIPNEFQLAVPHPLPMGTLVKSVSGSAQAGCDLDLKLTIANHDVVTVRIPNATRWKTDDALLQQQSTTLNHGFVLRGTQSPNCSEWVVVDPRCWGYNAEDSTAALQAALDAATAPTAAYVLISPGVWKTRPLFVGSNTSVVFEPGAILEAVRGSFHGVADALLTVSAASNVSIRGAGTLRMWRDDYANRSLYSKAEWRHTVNILDSERVSISGLALNMSGGDGIYIGSNFSRPGGYSRDVHVSMCMLNDHYRNAVSVTGGVGVLIEDSTMSGTKGTNPQMAVDVEPNSIFGLVQNITIRRCRSTDNSGGGFNLSPDSASSSGHPVSVLFDGCVSAHDGLAAFSVLRNRNVSGQATFRNCTAIASEGAGIQVMGKSVTGVDVSFEHCALHGTSVSGGGFQGNPVVLGPDAHYEQYRHLGGVRFLNLTVVDTSWPRCNNRPWFVAKCLQPGCTFSNVIAWNTTVTTASEAGCTQDVEPASSSVYMPQLCKHAPHRLMLLERMLRQIKSDDEQPANTARITTTSCSFAAATANGSCLAFTGLARLPIAVWPVRSSNQGQTVFVATPGHNVTAVQTTCTTFVSVAEAPAFQQSIKGHTCYALGDLTLGCPTTALIDPQNASAGLLLSYTGGTPTNGRARALRYRLVCDSSAPVSAGPTAEAEVGASGDRSFGC